MAEVAKPDYLSLVNKGGSGFNVSELVTSIVAAEIEPKRAIHKTKQEKTENAISGIALLNAQASSSKINFDTLASENFYSLTSSNSTGLSLKVTDETKISVGNRTISNVQTAQNMIFEFAGFTSLTETFSANLTLDFGEWTKADLSAAGNSYEAGKTYKITSDIIAPANNSDIAAIKTKSNYDGALATTIPAGTIVKFDDNAVNGTIGSSSLQNLDTYSFSALAGTTAIIDFSTETLTLNQIAARFDAVTGLSAKVIDTAGDGSAYSLVVSGTATGAKNGFRITGDERWLTPTAQEGHSKTNNFSQLSRNASFSLDGVIVSRTKNIISDVIDGVEVELKTDFSTSASISALRSESAVKNTVINVIGSMNAFKKELDALTYIDVEGDANGPLAMDPSVVSVKSRFKRLSVTPMTGFGSSSIYLSQLGIKTNSNGEYYLDEATFEKTYASNPEYFAALKDDNLSTNNLSIKANKSQFTKTDDGTYNITDPNGDGNYVIQKAGSTDAPISLLKVAYNGGSRFTTSKIPGLVIDSAVAAPSAFEIYFGSSFSKKVSNFMADISAISSSVSKAKETYTTTKVDIEERLQKLEVREKLITTQYTERFGNMEKSMSQFNSTKSLLENFVEAWKKQK
jgi:flagellar hook-associated protein 2